ncbi:PP0621 family protein [Ottowia sp.]|uniref:PP0621 family protein n=1 Tax=Ottowia sp. TaxID=1898956 RepID=UPI002B76FCF0|nr:PP0621 family protein [Ottowia sp.]HOB65191.1 PP0621 family protein [Ottowia sp.]HPZ56799.1 PP0621 family protein [Ottowia sp.]HQD48195.1 PP0621 family protein [Ottowia sp.]
MKLLLVLLAVLAGVWLWQRGRRLSQASRASRGGERAALPMVSCRQCGMHVPGNEAVAGRQGTYCSAAHRRDAEGA